ncbi:hypothetical protein Trydic_g14861 [Trypoxylus dichotomus]
MRIPRATPAHSIGGSDIRSIQETVLSRVIKRRYCLHLVITSFLAFTAAAPCSGSGHRPVRSLIIRQPPRTKVLFKLKFSRLLITFALLEAI